MAARLTSDHSKAARHITHVGWYRKDHRNTIISTNFKIPPPDDPIPGPSSHPEWITDIPGIDKVMGVSNSVDGQLNTHSYNQDDVDMPVGDMEDTPMDDSEDTSFIHDIWSTIIGEHTFIIESEDAVDYYQEALESLQNEEHQTFTCRPSSEELGIKTEEGLIDGPGSCDNNIDVSDCVNKSNSFGFKGIYQIISSPYELFSHLIRVTYG